jgi:xylulokinase
MTASATPYCLAIDLGTSGPKVALVSLRGEVAAWTFEPTPVDLLPNGGAEQDPRDWWAAITRAAQRLKQQAGVSVDDVIAVSCTGQWSGTVAVDDGGQPLGKAIIWMDSRGAPYVRQITGGPLRIAGYGVDKLARWLPLTGGIPAHSGKDSIAHILFLKHERPEVYRAAQQFLEPKDYLNLRLTGRGAASFDSIALHWLTDNRDIQRVRYDAGLFRLAGLDANQFPELKRAVDVLGPLTAEAAAELGLKPGTPVVLGTPDVHSAAVGSGAVRDYEAHLYLGTSAWITCHVPFKKTDLDHNMASLPSAIPGRYLVANAQETAGACLTYLRDQLFFAADELRAAPAPDDLYAVFDRMAARVPAGSDGLIFLPWLYGERTPIEDHTVRGGFFNQSLQTTRAHLVRAVFEGVACNARWLLDAVERFAGRRFAALNMIGGGAASDVWCQIHADVLGRTIQQVKDPILANLRGAAWLAAVGLGHTTFDALSERVPIARIYHPNPALQPLYAELFREFVALYRRNRAAYARLNRNRVGEQ